MKSKSLLLTVAIIIATINMNACAQKNVKVSSTTSVKNFPIEAFEQLNIKSVAKIEFTQSNHLSVRAEGDEAAVNNLLVNSDNGNLNISMIDDKLHNNNKNKLNLTIYISSPQLTKIYHQGVGTFNLKDKVEINDLKIEYEGVGNLIAEDLICDNLIIDYKGVGNLKLKGKSTTAIYNSEGVGNVQADKFEVEHLTVRASGVGSVKCYSSNSIDISSDGIGSVTYYGNPEVKKINKNGLGKIKEVK